jgi:hypothetical protein
MSVENIKADIAVIRKHVESAASHPGRELSETEVASMVGAALNLVERLLIDIHTIASPPAVVVDYSQPSLAL